MNEEKTVSSSQEQAVAAWTSYLRASRLADLARQLAKQNQYYNAATGELQAATDFVQHPAHILGSYGAKHGEVAEVIQVRFSNADELIQGNRRTHSFQGVGRFDKEDYHWLGRMVQSKFCGSPRGTFRAIREHLIKYPDFIADNGIYDIPKDQYETLSDILWRGEHHRSSLSNSEETIFKNIKQWEDANNVSFHDVVRPSVVNYDDVQLNVVEQTIDDKQKQIDSINEEKKAIIEDNHQPTLEEGLKVTGTAAAVEGATALVLGVYKKVKDGTPITEFSVEDWKELGIDTAKGTAKGGLRGASLYYLVNYAGTPAPIANALFSATFGMFLEAQRLATHQIGIKEFTERSLALNLDVSVSALSALIGEIIIPVPILGAVLGNAAGTFMLEISRAFLDKHEQRIIADYIESMQSGIAKVEDEFQALLAEANSQFSSFSSLVDLAFSPDANERLHSAVQRALLVGVDKDKVNDVVTRGIDLFNGDTPFVF